MKKFRTILLNLLTFPDTLLFIWYDAGPRVGKEIKNIKRKAEQKGKQLRPHDVNFNNILRKINQSITTYHKERPWALRAVATLVTAALVWVGYLIA